MIEEHIVLQGENKENKEFYVKFEIFTFGSKEAKEAEKVLENKVMIPIYELENKLFKKAKKNGYAIVTNRGAVYDFRREKPKSRKRTNSKQSR